MSAGRVMARAAVRVVLRHLFALASMAVGGGGVLWLVTTMNRPVPPAEAPVRGEREAISVAPPPPPERKPREAPKPPPRPPQAPRPRSAPPPPSVAGAALDGLDLGLPAFAPTGLAGVERSLVDTGQAAKSLVMTEDAVDTPPRPVSRKAPSYPPRARAKQVTGSVTLRLLVGERGDVVEARVTGSEPAGIFDDAALEAVRGWRFQPGTYKGEPVRVWVRQTVRFNLG